MAVDTGMRRRIFHPKVFVALGEREARLVIGSANLTFGGLSSNIEASVDLELTRTDRDDAAFVSDVVAQLDRLEKDHPQHVFHVPTISAARELLAQGRLVDETAEKPKPSGNANPSKSRDNLRRMALSSVATPVPRTRKLSRRPAKVAPRPPSSAYELVWVSKPLVRRDLSIPKSPTTNPAGSMLWKKGATTVDQMHFFREHVFRELNWVRDPNPKKHIWERASAKFEVIIKGVNYGEFQLNLSHNADKESATWKERNSPTQVHWGPIREIISQQDLLDRTLRLYKREGAPPTYLIEID